jgi:hypothetical protein
MIHVQGTTGYPLIGGDGGEREFSMAIYELTDWIQPYPIVNRQSSNDDFIEYG